MIKNFFNGALTGLAIVLIIIGAIAFGMIVLLPFFLLVKYLSLWWLLLYIPLIPFLGGIINIFNRWMEEEE